VEGETPRHSLAEEAAAWVPPWERETAAPDPSAAGSAVVGPSAAGSDVADPPAAGSEAPDGTLPASAARSTTEPTGPTGPEGSTVDLASSTMDSGTGVEDTAQLSSAATEPVRAAEPGPAPEPAPQEPEPAPAREPAPAPAPVPMDVPALRGALEAIMLVVDEPVSEMMLAQVLEQPTEVVAKTLADLAAEYSAAGRGFDLRRVAGGWRLYTRGDFAPYVERFVLDGQQVRLTQAALETLAVVAYKQPVTRSRISAIRGVNCDGVIRTLVSRGLVEECGTEPDSGAFLYRTTTLFLEKLGLDSVSELPPLAPFLPDDVDDIADVQPR
jgi:segregation and condensation protein B